MTIGIDSSLLLSIYQSKLGVLGLGMAGATGGTTGTAAAPPPKPVAPTPPWSTVPTTQETSDDVAHAMAGGDFIDENAAKLDLPGASQDYKKLFTIYQALTTLQNVASQMNQTGLSDAQKTRINDTFTRGLGEISDYINSADMDSLRVVQGSSTSSDTTTIAVPKNPTAYTTPPLTSSQTTEVPAFEGDVQFNISIKRVNTTVNVPIDLSNMGTQPRTLPNVVNYINSQLAASGMATRVANTRIPGQAQTITSGTKTITLPAAPDQWAMTVNAGLSETVTFSAPQTANAVYVTQQVGSDDPDLNPETDDSTLDQELTKFQTDTDNVPAPLQKPGQANWTDGRVSATDLGPNVGTVHASQVGPDGSVYVLADVTGTVNGQSIKGEQDVALMKYDSTGKIVYTQTLGASDSATGLGLAVSSTGQVAVTGSVSGGLNGSTDGALNSGTTGAFANESDSFVTLYDASGQEMWTERRGSSQQDQASQVAFGDDGTVYVSGQTQSAMPGATADGGQDGYIEAFQTTAQGNPKVLFTQTVGSSGADKPAGMVVNGNSLYTASVENGHAVVRQFDTSSGAPVLMNTRDVGDLQGGSIAGLAMDGNQLVLAGTTSNGSLSGATVTSAAAGGTDAFALKMSSDLNPTSTDEIAYYGGSGDDKATAMAVSNGQVWIAGTTDGDLPNEAKIGAKDGFLVNLNVDTGNADYSQRFTGKNGQATPTSIAVDPTGASVLDRIGLPDGVMNPAGSQELTSVSSIRPGDQFTVQSEGGIKQTITIDPGETLDTLATKIKRASGFAVNITLSTTSAGRKMNISPVNDRAEIQFGPGKPGSDALAALGIPQGAIVNTTTNDDGKTVPSDGGAQIYALGIPDSLNLSDPSQVSHALAQISAAVVTVRGAYQDMVAAATPKSQQVQAAKPITGTVPAYLTAQIANYQAGLARLTGTG
jgi:hypothetical protein